MNKFIGIGRLTRDPDVRYSQGENSKCVARYTLAVDRRFAKKEEGQQTADFISCVVFGKGAEFAEKYFHKGLKVLVEGRIQTNSWTDKDGNKKFSMNVVLDSQEFADSKSQSSGAKTNEQDSINDGFIDIQGSIDDEELPF